MNIEALIIDIDVNQSKLTIENDGDSTIIQVKQGKKNKIKVPDLKVGSLVYIGTNEMNGKPEVKKILKKKKIEAKVIDSRTEIKESSKIKEVISNFEFPPFKVSGENISSKYPYNFIESDFNTVPRSSYSLGENSGYVDISITNSSPLLIFDGKGEKAPDGTLIKSHVKNDNGEYIIPASSLKGLMRNNLEVLSNSCYSIFDDREEKMIQDYRLDFNKKKVSSFFSSLETIPGRVIEKDGKLYLEELEEAWINDKALSSSDKIELDESGNPKEKIELEVAENNGWNGRRFIRGINLVNTPFDKNKINKTPKNRWGYIKDTGINFGNTHHQRFFYENKKSNNEYLLDSTVLRKYKEVLKRQKEENEKNHTFNGGPNKFKTTYHHKEARPGALVWGIYDRNSEKIIGLSYVQTPKVAYYNYMKDLLNEASPCEDLESLCYACRVFGTIVKDTEVAVRGRVNFSDLLLQGDAKVVTKNNIRMDILDSPRPSNANFYINKNYDSYDQEDATIRGRKVFWHHKDKQDIHDESQLQSTNIVNNGATENQTDYIKPILSGNLFKGKIHFNRLTDEELGSLLLALGEKNSYFKLGAGKPLGMGSIKPHNIKLFLESKEDKYTSFENTFKQIDVSSYIDAFKEEIEDNFKESFETLKFISEYKRITESVVDFSKENYPAAFGKTPGKNTLNWFMENKNHKLEEILQYREEDRIHKLASLQDA